MGVRPAVGSVGQTQGSAGGCSTRRACPWEPLAAPPHVPRGRDVAPQAQTLCCLLSLEIPSPLAASPSSLVSIQEGRAPPTKRCSPCRRSEWPICCQLRSRGESPPELQQRGQRPRHGRAWAFTRKGGSAALALSRICLWPSRPSYQPHHPAGPQV